MSCLCLALLLWNRKRVIPVRPLQEEEIASAVTAFQQSNAAIREAKREMTGDSSGHPAWVPTRGMIVVLVAVVLVVGGCLSSCILFRFISK